MTGADEVRRRVADRPRRSDGSGLERASGYPARDVEALEALPSLPRATYSQLTAFAKHLGYDFDVGPSAAHRRPGIFARILGR